MKSRCCAASLRYEYPRDGIIWEICTLCNFHKEIEDKLQRKPLRFIRASVDMEDLRGLVMAAWVIAKQNPDADFSEWWKAHKPLIRVDDEK